MRVRAMLVFVVACSLAGVSLKTHPVYAQQPVTTEPPPQASAQPSEPCPKGERGGAIGGIVVGSVFWWVLPMSIPVLITQTRKLKAHNQAKLERRCQYAPAP